MEQNHQSDPTTSDPAPAAPPQSRPDPRLAQLERHLLEAFDELWDNSVDPAEAYCDVDGTRWTQLGGSPAQGAAAGLPFRTEQQLGEIRDQCRSLAVGNEFAINGHEYWFAELHFGYGDVFGQTTPRRAAAVVCRLFTGEPVSAPRIGRELGMSRTGAAEAIRQAASDQLVRSVQGRGWRPLEDSSLVVN